MLNTAQQIEVTQRPMAPISQDKPLYTIATEALEKCDYDKTKAEELLFNEITTNPREFKSVIDAAIRTAIDYELRHAISTNRRNIIKSIDTSRTHGSVVAGRSKAGVVALASVIRNSILDMIISNGKRLRDATSAEIIETADKWDSQAKTMADRARGLRAIAKVIPLGKKCGDVLSEQKAEFLFKKAA